MIHFYYIFIILYSKLFFLFVCLFVWLGEATYTISYIIIYTSTYRYYLYTLYIYIYIGTMCVLYNHVKMTYTTAKTNVIEGSVIKNTRVADRVDFSLNDFRKNGTKNCVYLCTCMRIIHLYNVMRFMYRNGWTHKSHRSYFSPRRCYFLSNSHRFFACFHYYNIIYSPWNRVVFWSKKQFGSARMI